MAQACLPSMKEQGGGAIVNVSTMAAVNPFPGEGYAASKGYARDDTPHGKRFWSVRYSRKCHPHGLDWRQAGLCYIDRQVEAGTIEMLLLVKSQRIPLGIIPPEEDCALAVFFISDYARVVSGGTLDVNGGQYMSP